MNSEEVRACLLRAVLDKKTELAEPAVQVVVQANTKKSVGGYSLDEIGEQQRSNSCYWTCLPHCVDSDRTKPC